MDEPTTDPPAGDASAPQPPVPRTGDDGKPVYDQEFFLALARCGKEVWNEWREQNPVISAKFTGVDFRETRITNFSGFRFGHAADFSSAVFGNGFDLSGAYFGDQADLSGTVFGNDANLSGAIFEDRARFVGAKFGDRAQLRCAVFGVQPNFSLAEFGDQTNFFSVTLAIFADFTGARFRGDVFFSAVSSDLWPGILNIAIGHWPSDQQDRFRAQYEKMEQLGFSQGRFSIIRFFGTQFEGTAHFARRKFGGRCDFTNARFNAPPVFDGCEGGNNVDFYGARIGFLAFDSAGLTRGWTTTSEVAVRLRALRKFAEDIKNHDLERDLYIEERKAERGILLAQHWRNGWLSPLNPKLVSHCLWIGIMAAFFLFADYGRSFVRPLVALAVGVPLFWWTYAAVLVPPTDTNKVENFRRATWAFAISNAVPFVGALTLERDVKLTLLCGDRPIDAQHAQASGQPICVPIPGRRFQLLALGQSIFSALCIFFAGLALRNYFKLR